MSIYTVLIKAPPMFFLMGFFMFKADCGGEVSQTYYIEYMQSSEVSYRTGLHFTLKLGNSFQLFNR